MRDIYWYTCTLVGDEEVAGEEEEEEEKKKKRSLTVIVFIHIDRSSDSAVRAGGKCPQIVVFPAGLSPVDRQPEPAWGRRDEEDEMSAGGLTQKKEEEEEESGMCVCVRGAEEGFVFRRYEPLSPSHCCSILSCSVCIHLSCDWERVTSPGPSPFLTPPHLHTHTQARARTHTFSPTRVCSG